jgi:hypothetical protein
VFISIHRFTGSLSCSLFFFFNWNPRRGLGNVDPFCCFFTPVDSFFISRKSRQVLSKLTLICGFYNDEPVHYGTTRSCLQVFNNVEQSLESNSQVRQHSSLPLLTVSVRMKGSWLANSPVVHLPIPRYMAVSTMAFTQHKGMVLLGTIPARTH